MGRKRGAKGRRRMFVTSLEQMEKRDKDIQQRAEQRTARRKEKGCESEDTSSDDESKDGALDGDAAARVLMGGHGDSSEEEEREVKGKGVAGLLGPGFETANLNAKKKQNLKVGDLTSDIKVELSRREREAIEAEQRKRDYMKLHAEGKTDEFQADKARLDMIRARREQDKVRQQKVSEMEAKKKEKKSKKAVTSSDEEELEKLDARSIKKMNPSKLKDELKKRGLDIQGNKKALQKRLIAAMK